MALRKRQNLEGWIRDAMMDPDKGKPITGISLVHMVGTAQDEMHSVQFGNGPKEPKDLAELFQSKAETFSQDLPGTQTFCLLAFYGESKEPMAKHPFVVSGQTGMDGMNGLMTEGPTPTGALQQAMRHYEATQQSTYRKDGMLFDKMTEIINMQGTMLTTAMSRHHDAIQLAERLIIEKAQNDHNFRMEEMKFERQSEERKRWLTYLPALANSILGKEIFPQSTADTSLIETIAESLSEEQIQKLASALPPEILGPLMGRFEEMMKTKRLKREQQTRLLKDNNPEEDMAGEG